VSYRLEKTIQGLPKLPNAIRWKHWATVRKHDQDWHWSVYWAVQGLRPPEPLPWAELTLIRHSAKEPDPDALAQSFKPVIDGLVKCEVLADDSAKHVALDCRWEKAPPRRGYITVIVTEP